LMQGNARDEMQLADRTRDDGSEAGYRKSKKWKNLKSTMPPWR